MDFLRAFFLRGRNLLRWDAILLRTLPPRRSASQLSTEKMAQPQPCLHSTPRTPAARVCIPPSTSAH